MLYLQYFQMILLVLEFFQLFHPFERTKIHYEAIAALYFLVKIDLYSSWSIHKLAA